MHTTLKPQAGSAGPSTALWHQTETSPGASWPRASLWRCVGNPGFRAYRWAQGWWFGAVIVANFACVLERICMHASVSLPLFCSLSFSVCSSHPMPCPASPNAHRYRRVTCFCAVSAAVLRPRRVCVSLSVTTNTPMCFLAAGRVSAVWCQQGRQQQQQRRPKSPQQWPAAPPPPQVQPPGRVTHSSALLQAPLPPPALAQQQHCSRRQQWQQWHCGGEGDPPAQDRGGHWPH
jgi:hypothetical protein